MDKQAFTEKTLAIEASLYAVARTYLRTPFDCADAVQEAVLKAWKQRHTLRNEQYFKTWVTRILINECKTMRRKGGRTIALADIPEAALPESDAGDPLALSMLQTLDIKYRGAFVLYHIEGYSTKEIATILRIPQGTVTSRLKRARRLLQEDLQKAEAII